MSKPMELTVDLTVDGVVQTLLGRVLGERPTIGSLREKGILRDDDVLVVNGRVCQDPKLELKNGDKLAAARPSGVLG